MSVTKNQLINKFSQVPNALITDTSISHGAFRVMVYLFSRPDNWQVNNYDIKKNLGIGQDDTIAGYWSKLLESGWISRKRNGGGGFDYTLNMEKQDVSNNNDNEGVFGKTPNRGYPVQGEMPTHSNTEPESNTESDTCSADAEPPTSKSQQSLKEKNTAKDSERSAAASRVLAYLNEKAGTSYVTDGKRAATNIKIIIPRLNDGYTEDELKLVIDNRCSKWLADDKMREFLRPSTLFSVTNLSNYLEEATRVAPANSKVPLLDVPLNDETRYSNWLRKMEEYPKTKAEVRFFKASEFNSFFAERPDWWPNIWSKWEFTLLQKKFASALRSLEDSPNRALMAKDGLFTYLKQWFIDERDGKH